MGHEPPKGWAAAGKAAKDLAHQDQRIRADADRDRANVQRSVALVSDVKARPHGDTRQVDAYHVLALAESVAVLGLLEPLVVDRELRLLAGAHRWEAVQLLAMVDPEQRAQRWSVLAGFPEETAVTGEALAATQRIRALAAMPHPAEVPVRIMDLNAEAEGNRALAIEVAENEKRRDYTRTEVEALAKRLKKAGYRDDRGKPKTGQRALGPALAVIIGKSARTVRRFLSGDDAPKKPAPQVSEQQALASELNRLALALQRVAAYARGPGGDQYQDLWPRIAALEEEMRRIVAGTAAGSASST
jgi:ParB family chromosome partitioning protein